MLWSGNGQICCFFFPFPELVDKSEHWTEAWSQNLNKNHFKVTLSQICFVKRRFCSDRGISITQRNYSQARAQTPSLWRVTNQQCCGTTTPLWKDEEGHLWHVCTRSRMCACVRHVCVCVCCLVHILEEMPRTLLHDLNCKFAFFTWRVFCN